MYTGWTITKEYKLFWVYTGLSLVKLIATNPKGYRFNFQRAFVQHWPYGSFRYLLKVCGRRLRLGWLRLGLLCIVFWAFASIQTFWFTLYLCSSIVLKNLYYVLFTENKMILNFFLIFFFFCTLKNFLYKHHFNAFNIFFVIYILVYDITYTFFRAAKGSFKS